MYYCRDHFWAPLSESRCPVIKKHGCQCDPGIDGGVEQTNIEFQFFVDFYLVSSVL